MRDPNLPLIPYGKQLIDQSDVDAVVETLHGDYLTTGPSVEGFEEALCERTGAKFAIACANGTAALHLACLALELPKGFSGFTSPITFVASANCIEYCGGSTSFVDINPNSLCISIEDLERRCEEMRPDVVIPVHFAGIPAAPEKIQALASKFHFKIIEDAAHALGSTYSVDNQRYEVGQCAHSDMAILSFHPVKTITTGEGGAVTTNDPILAERLRRYRSHGITRNPELMKANHGPWYYEQIGLGFNYRITDLQCALGISQLQKLNSFIERRREIVARYNDAFSRLDSIITPPTPSGTMPCYHIYPIQIQGASRLEWYKELKAEGILTQVHYIPVHTQPYYVEKYGNQTGQFPHAEQYYSTCLSLPLFPAMEDEHVQRVINAVMKITEYVSS